MLQDLAHWVAAGQRRHILFALATLITVLFLGYTFGTFDQTIHIPFLKRYADPTLFPGDPFIDLRLTHYSYFWRLFEPFYRLGVLEITMFIVHVAVVYGTFWALWALSQTLFASPLSSLLVVAGFIFPHIGFAGFPVIEFSLLNRTFVLPFLLVAINLFVRRRIVLAFLLAGLMYNLHVISVQFVLAMFLLDAVVEVKSVGWRRLAAGLIVFLIAALPVLFWKLTGTPVDFAVRMEWFQTIARGTLFNLFYLFPPYAYILVMTISGFSALALFVIARRSQPPSPQHRTLDVFVAACLIVLAVQVLTAQFAPMTIIVQSQIIRAGTFILIFGYVYFADYLARAYQARRAVLDWAMLAGSYGLTALPLGPLAVWSAQHLVPGAAARRMLGGGIMLGFAVAGFVIAFKFNAWQPAIQIYGPRTAWEDAQFWARDNTPRDALFITPPNIWWLYTSDWRVFSERSTLATLADLLEVAFAPEYMSVWQPRFEALAPGAQARFRGDLFENRQLTGEAFYGLTTADFQGLASRFGADYLVVGRGHDYALPVAYENAEYRIYALGGGTP
jgi:hypothetical protein